MSQLLVEPEQETFPNRKRWTRQDCAKLQGTGLLPDRFELIDGEVMDKMGQNPPHSVTLMLIANWLISLFGKLYVREQEPIRIVGNGSDYNEPEPDIAITLGSATAYSVEHPAAVDLVLVVEVADTTLRFDLGPKSLLYARCGVLEYWVADVIGQRIHVYRGPTGEGYSDVTTISDMASIATLAHPNAAVAVATLFPPLIA